MGFTLVSFHAHPDDEALFTGGTLARASAEGHRVVLVVATLGEAGLAERARREDGRLAARRAQELDRSAAALGCREVRLLGYDDSGLDGRGGRPGQAFASAEIGEAAGRLAAVLREVRADVLTIYDPGGGYGHPDHVQVHRVGTEAARMAGTAVVLEATVDRQSLLRVLKLLRLVGATPPDWAPARFVGRYNAREEITHRVDVRDFTPHKRRSMAAHVSQTTADQGTRTLALFLRLPQAVFRRVFGYEWFVEQGRARSGDFLDDIFDSLRSGSGSAQESRSAHQGSGSAHQEGGSPRG